MDDLFYGMILALAIYGALSLMRDLGWFKRWPTGGVKGR
jgi:hypothetical protein